MPESPRESTAGSDAGGDDTQSPTTVIVTLNDSAAAADVSRIKDQLEESGLAVTQVLDFIGQIVGTSRSANLESLKAIDGVDDVEVSQAIQLPPPGSVTQ